MKQKIQLQIPEPCHENWNDMTATQLGRFCLSCRKEVIDFSVMTDKEILQYISTASEGICGRAASHQVNRYLVAPPEPRKIWWKYWMGLAASLVILSSKSNAQVRGFKNSTICQPPIVKKDSSPVIMLGGIRSVSRDDEVKIQISGKVIDERVNSISYSSVTLKHKQAGVIADAAGNFELITKASLTDVELTVSAAGHQQKTIKMSSVENINAVAVEKNIVKINVGDIVMKDELLDEVVVCSKTTNISYQVLAGAIGVRRKRTLFEKTKSVFSDSLLKNDIKIYPNPVPANSVFNVSFNLKDPGGYVMQFVDASGRIVFGKQLNIPSKNYVEGFNGNIFAAHGIYFVNLTNKQTGKMYTTKLLVQ